MGRLLCIDVWYVGYHRCMCGLPFVIYNVPSNLGSTTSLTIVQQCVFPLIWGKGLGSGCAHGVEGNGWVGPQGNAIRVILLINILLTITQGSISLATLVLSCLGVFCYQL